MCVPWFMYTQVHAKTLLLCSNDLQCVLFVSRSPVPLLRVCLLKRAGGEECRLFLSAACMKWFENVVESIKGWVPGVVSGPDSPLSS